MTFLLKVSSYTFFILLLLILASVVIYTIKKPSNNKQWSLGNTHTASVEIDSKNTVKITNFRDVDWISLKAVDTTSIDDKSLFKTREFLLEDIQSLRVVVSHFAILSEVAHILILFELKDNSKIGLSVEARRELGENYSLSGGLTAKFEVINLFASYRDLVGLRVSRGESVYSYPIKATPDEVQSLFKVAAERTNQLHYKPELYHLFIKNCTTEIVKLVNKISDANFSRLTQSFMPGNAGKSLYNMGLIDSEQSFGALQKSALIKKL